MDLQYISDTDGRQTAVIIPIQDWHDLTAKHQDLRDLEKSINRGLENNAARFKGLLTNRGSCKI